MILTWINSMHIEKFLIEYFKIIYGNGFSLTVSSFKELWTYHQQNKNVVQYIGDFHMDQQCKYRKVFNGIPQDDLWKWLLSHCVCPYHSIC